MECLICNADTVPYTTKSAAGVAWNVVRCTTCGLGFVSNRPSSEFLNEYYGSTITPPIARQPREQRSDCIQLVSQLSSQTTERGWSLDVGSGDGGFSYHLHKQGFKPVLIDLSVDGSELSADIPGREFHVTSFENFKPDRKFSVILMSQVLEHARNPVEWLQHAVSLLSPAGVLCVAVPNFSGVYRLFGTRDPFLCPPQHLNFFSPASLVTLFNKVGLARTHVRSASNICVLRRGAFWHGLGNLWNTCSSALDPTSKGIILQVSGTRV